MFERTDVSAVAQITPSEAAQLALLQLGDCDYQLARNPNLSEKAWMVIWKRRIGAQEQGPSAISHLIHNASTPAQMEKIITQADRRCLVPTTLDRNSPINPTIARAISEKLCNAPDFDEMDAAACISSGGLPSELVLPFLNKVLDSVSTTIYPAISGDHDFFLSGIMETALTYYHSVTNQDVIEILESFPEGEKYNARVLDFRPTLMPLMLTSTRAEYFYQSVAESRHLFEPAATRLLTQTLLQIPNWGTRQPLRAAVANLTQNPNVSIPTKLIAHQALLLLEVNRDTFDELPNKSVRRKLYERTLEEQRLGFKHVCSPWESATPAELEVIAHHLSRAAASLKWNYPSLLSNPNFQKDNYNSIPVGISFSRKQIVEKITPELDALGPDAWSLFVAMLPEWKLTYEELIATIASMA